MGREGPHEPATTDKGESPNRPETAPTSGRIPTSDVLGGGGVLDLPAGSGGEALPKQIGKYKIVKQLGRGGMGVVLLGVRDEDQFHTRVAIKLIRRGIDSATDGREVLKRFDLERQVLGALNHPNIARLLDAGQMPDPDGRPYFVMEMVEGEPIDEYCDRMQLHTEERLRLFQKVCAAVHHAHQNLVVHRDIKPSNILVDSKGEPKLMDFGIAKLMNPAMAALTMATSWEKGPMTPEYASPEQVQGKPISTASDVYALGVLLYELLTGRRPYKLKSRAIDAMVKAICEDEPERPSTAVTHEDTLLTSEGETRTITADSLAKPREGAVTRLKRKLSGDVDNIVLMAMRKSPARRYPSAEAMAADIEKHLKGDAISAAPDSVVYRFGKFARRNKTGLAAALIVLASIIGGGAAAGVAWQREKTARIAELAAKERAERLLEAVRRMGSAYTSGIPKIIAPMEDSTPALRALADSAVAGLDGIRAEFANDLAMQREIANAYALAGRIKGGMRGGNEGDAEAGLKMLDQATAIRREIVKAAPEDKKAKAELAVALVYRGDALKLAKKSKEANEQYAEALKIIEEIGEQNLNDPLLERTYAVTLLTRGETLPPEQSDAAGELFRKSLAIREKLASGNERDLGRQRDVTVAQGRLADWHAARGEPDKAIALYRKAYETRERLVGIESNARTQRDVATAARVYALALAESATPDFDEAERLLDRALKLTTALTLTDSSSSRAREDHVRAHADFGVLELIRRNPTKAREWLRRAIGAENPPPHQKRTAVMEFEMARVQEKLGDAELALVDKTAAKAAYQESLRLVRALGTETPALGAAEERLVEAMRKVTP